MWLTPGVSKVELDNNYWYVYLQPENLNTDFSGAY